MCLNMIAGWKQQLSAVLVLSAVLGTLPRVFAQELQRVSVVLPIMPGEPERWARPRPEPITLDLPGWMVRTYPASPSLPNEHIISFTRDACDVQLIRFWDHPLTDGGPTSFKGSRTVSVAGRQTELYTTTAFEGMSREVEVLWLTGKGYDVEYIVRLRFERCPGELVEEVLRRVAVHW